MFRSSALLQLCLVGLLAQLGASNRLTPQDGTRERACPDEEVIAPCICTTDEDLNLFLDCSEARTVAELEHAFAEPFNDTEFEALTIDQTECGDCYLTSLPAGSLGYTTSFMEITITNTQIEVVGDTVFNASYNTLVTLRLSSNKIDSFPSTSIENYKVLRQVYLNANGFKGTDPIQDLESETLININLSSNDISVSPNFVLNCPAMKQVHMRNTQMKEVPIFDVSPIGMFTGLQNIQLIDFGANLITEIQANSIVAQAATLQTVNLSSNNISILHPGFVSGFSSAETSTLILSSNSIVKLDQQVWKDIFNELIYENSVDLSDNPLLCGCDLAWLVLSPLKSSLTDTTTCLDGVTVVKELPEAPYANCFIT